MPNARTADVVPLDTAVVAAEAALVRTDRWTQVHGPGPEEDSMHLFHFFAAGVEDNEGTQRQISSCKLVLGGILVRCDDSPQGNLDSKR